MIAFGPSIAVASAKLQIPRAPSELDPIETAELAQLIDLWRNRVVIETTISSLELFATNDDLALSARIHARISAREQQA